MALHTVPKKQLDPEVLAEGEDASALGSGAAASGEVLVADGAGGLSFIGVHKFSTSEAVTGTFWIDGKAVFRKVIDTGALPASGSSLVAHNITGMDVVVFIRGFAEDTNGNQIPLPHVDVGNQSNGDIGVAVNDTIVNISVAGDASAFDKSHVELWYTKV